MKHSIFFLTALFALALSATAQETAPSKPANSDSAPAATAVPSPTPSPSPAAKPGVYDYQNLPINDVLRDLGREAKVNLIIGPQVAGTITFHVENKTPLQVIEAIAQYRGLLYKLFEGNYYVATEGDWRDFMRNRYYFEAPELPAALAKYKRRYYDALIKEGFTKDEAMKIITSEPLPPHDLRFNY